MKKHVISYSESNQTYIGKGSVVLIKGKPETDGRRLYATYITGYAEIKPGIKMVFLGDQIYRVIYKGDNSFFGRKVDIRGEEGLMGVLNLRNNGTPSIVLNHNKTPFHWLTTRFTDIGAALRSLGPQLFSHDLILESEELNKPPVILDRIFIETMKALLKKDSPDVSVKSISIEGDGETYFGDSEGPEESGSAQFDWSLQVEVDPISNDLRQEMADQGLITGIMDPLLSDFLDVSDSTMIEIWFDSTSDWHVWYDPGSYYEPPEGGAEMRDIENDVTHIYMDDGWEYAVLPGKTDLMSEEAKSLLQEFMKHVSGFDSYDFYKMAK